jgi:alkanesulfonate monooxygenase SsuD/methylene tetrahydromethanopterin reductase-like flavin-dependent oxidoreductase (luciferase family)
VRRLLGGESVTASGEGFELTDATLALVPERMTPIWVGADSDGAVRRAARLGDAWLVNPHMRLDELERQMRLYRARRTRPGPSESTPVLKEVCVAATDEQAMEAARPHLKEQYDAYVGWRQSDVLPPTDTLRREFAELKAGRRFALGSPQTRATILAEHVDRLGAHPIICRLQRPGIPQHHMLNSMRLLAEEVLPARR